MTRFVDRGAVVAASVGVGMAVVIAISFLLVIPIEPVVWYLALPAGLLIGYYANQRAGRGGGPWPRILVNGGFAGAVTGLALGALLLATKGLFFAADTGFRDASAGGPLACSPGVGCVYERYLADGRGAELAAEGVTDAASFGRFYWRQQLATAATLLGLSTAGGLGGAALYGVLGRRPPSTHREPRSVAGT